MQLLPRKIKVPTCIPTNYFMMLIRFSFPLEHDIMVKIGIASEFVNFSLAPKVLIISLANLIRKFNVFVLKYTVIIKFP